VLPGGTLGDSCPSDRHAEVEQFAQIHYPPFLGKQDGIVIAEATIGPDGLARDPKIVAAAPLADFAPAAVDALHAANDQFAEAVSRQQTANERARDLYWNTSLIEERLKAYRAKQLWKVMKGRRLVAAHR
jgi:hypothetical protein